MLVCEIAIDARPRPFSNPGSSSRPIKNMNSTSPTWLTSWSTPSDSGGNSNLVACGQSVPSSDGPSTIPAVTSAITCGWPRRRTPSASTRETAMIATDCAMNRVRGL